jgi:hypothetical protein
MGHGTQLEGPGIFIILGGSYFYRPSTPPRKRLLTDTQKAAYGNGDTWNPKLDCGGTASSMEPLVYLGSLPYYKHIMYCFQTRVTRFLA